MRIYNSGGITADLLFAPQVGRDTGDLGDFPNPSPPVFDLNLRGKGWIVWPNREGEGFTLDSVYPALKKHDCLESGLSLSWPATAVCQGCAFFDSDDRGRLFHLEVDLEGRHRDIRIFSSSPEEVVIRFSGQPGVWSLQPLERKVPDRKLQGQYRRQSTFFHDYPLQFQLGLIGPDGESEIGKDEGFHVIGRVARLIAEKFGPFKQTPVLHLFGYGAGHDRMYPDYSPAERFGGEAGFKAGIQAAQRAGFHVSCYLNGRIMDVQCRDRFSELDAGICNRADVDGNSVPLIENYQERTFFVMDPNYQPWLDELYEQALMLQRLGADAVQIDQVAGRAAAVPFGAVWGRGYKSLICRLQAAGLKVWVQGVSDYYPADWFEMTYRDVNILAGGILRGGNPFGETDLSLLKPLGIQGQFLVPRSKLDVLGCSDLPFILDVLGDRGKLPLYGREYLAELASIEYPL
ncbi:MAG: hypothetical protein JEY99_05070 [Spirochaetales bacterium]|nr:hypothetical protein [Spirochaetales bacterium]